MTEYEALIVFIIVSAVSYPILYVLLKTIEHLFGTGYAIFTGVCLIFICIALIMRELKNNE